MKRKITDAVEIIDRRYGGDPEWEEMVAREDLNLRVGQAVYDLRARAGLTQEALASMAGTTQSIISKVENADYEGSAAEMLVRVCFALHTTVEITCVERSDPACNITLASG